MSPLVDAHDFQRARIFLLGGVANTALTLGACFLLGAVLDYRIAYLLAYTGGIVFAYFFNSLFVFRQAISWHSLLVYPLTYLLQFCLGFVCMELLVRGVGVRESIAPVIAAACTFPISYFLNKLALVKSAGS